MGISVLLKRFLLAISTDIILAQVSTHIWKSVKCSAII